MASAASPAPDFLRPFFDGITETAKRKRIRASFGLPWLDSYINGLFPGNLVIVGSRPAEARLHFSGDCTSRDTRRQSARLERAP
jgi:replicative DNA helicase